MNCQVSSIFRWASSICELPYCRLGCPSYPPTPGCHLEIEVPGDTLYSSLIIYPDNVKSLSLSRSIMYKWYIMQPQIVFSNTVFVDADDFPVQIANIVVFPHQVRIDFWMVIFLGCPTSNIQGSGCWNLWMRTVLPWLYGQKWTFASETGEHLVKGCT